MQKLNAAALFQGHAQGQEEVPAISPFAFAVELAGALIGQLASVEQRLQGLAVVARYPLDVSMQFVVVTTDLHGRACVSVALHALGQVVFHGLLKRPVAKADDVAVVGVGKQPVHAFLVAQVDPGVGLDGAAEGQCGQGEGQWSSLVHA
ncbi:hypothetical protein D3C79_667350 [compost metagenome]